MYLDTNINRLPLVFKTNCGKNYFEFHINGQLASLQYTMVGDQHIELLALEIDKYLNRTEVGNALMERVMEYAERADFKVIDTSLEVQSFLKKRPEYQKLVATAAIPLPQKTPQPNL